MAICLKQTPQCPAMESHTQNLLLALFAVRSRWLSPVLEGTQNLQTRCYVFNPHILFPPWVGFLPWVKAEMFLASFWRWSMISLDLGGHGCTLWISSTDLHIALLWLMQDTAVRGEGGGETTLSELVVLDRN